MQLTRCQSSPSRATEVSVVSAVPPVPSALLVPVVLPVLLETMVLR